MSLLPTFLYLVFNLLFGQSPGSTNIAGVYQGRPIFIQNAYDPVNRDFCIKEISVNGQKMAFNPKASAVKVDFKGVDMYAPVALKITHKDSCNPIVINPDAIFYHSIFSFSEIITTDSTLIWKTLGEKESGSFVVEKIDMGLWQEEAIIEASGRFEGETYTHYPKIKEGSNKFRIKYVLPSGKHLYSREIDLHFYPKPVTFTPLKTSKMLYFSRSATFKIYDAGNNVVMEGNGKETDVSHLPTGSYVIYFNEDDPGLFVKQ
ncbi:MAG: hypothetical protein ABJG41_20630 [Cyclobacteriaceae bacterium]